jgi:hypothetical protein
VSADKVVVFFGPRNDREKMLVYTAAKGSSLTKVDTWDNFFSGATTGTIMFLDGGNWNLYYRDRATDRTFLRRAAVVYKG